MSTAVSISLCAFASALLIAGPADVSPNLEHRPLYTFNESDLDRYLRDLPEPAGDLTGRVVALGRKNIGQPYEIYLLGEYPFELFDPDPIYCLAKSDCLTFCEHTYALALSSDWWMFLNALQRLRYKDGRIGMLQRNHFTLADWNHNNRFLFEDVTPRLGDGQAAVTLNQVCRRAAFFAKFGLGKDIPDESICDSYVPKDRVPAILAELKDADFVNIIRGDKDSQWAGHTGLIALAEDGSVNFLHSAKPAVREQSLIGYLQNDKRAVGIKILRLRPNAKELMETALDNTELITQASLERAVAALAKSEAPTAHQLVMHSTPTEFARGTCTGAQRCSDKDGMLLVWSPWPVEQETRSAAIYESPIIEADASFNQALLSCNVDASPDVTFQLALRVGRKRSLFWSPYLLLAKWGTAVFPGRPIVEFGGGRIDVDHFISDQIFDRLQYRIEAVNNIDDESTSAVPSVIRIGRVAACLSDTTGQLTSVSSKNHPSEDANLWQRQLAVPARTQKVERPEISGKICSPTSLAMVLAYRGASRPTEAVANRVWDETGNSYGNWPRAVQAAYEYGVPGYLARFSRWQEVERLIARDQPLIISITAEQGQLSGAPYEKTSGHLLVITGFDARGNVLVNDPAAPNVEEVPRSYSRAELDAVWLQRKHGTAYVLLPACSDGPATQESIDGSDEPLVDLALIDPRILRDLRYATSDNFTQQVLYPTAKCLLRLSVARRLKRVQDHLVKEGLGLKIYDGYRPLSVQKKMWALVPDPRYVADPAKGSRHNRGAAVDVTLIDIKGLELEMPTEYDDFTEAAHRDYAGGTPLSRRNRQLLFDALEREGFSGLATEWWHFDAPDWQKYPVLDKPLNQVIDCNP